MEPVKDVEIVDFSCGQNHTVAIDSKKRVYSWGFGGYGRLGHAEPKDEYVSSKKFHVYFIHFDVFRYPVCSSTSTLNLAAFVRFIAAPLTVWR